MSRTEARPSVVVLSFSPIARDPRVLRQVKLFETFADVTTVGYGPAPEGVVRHVEVPTSMRDWRTKRFAAPLLFWTRQYRRLYFGAERMKFVRAAIPPGSVDVVVANDELAAPLAVKLKPRGGVHVDFHEYSPGRNPDSLDWRLRVLPFFRWACKAARKADSVSTVAPGIAAKYGREFGLVCSVVPNAAEFRGDLVPSVPGVPLRLVHIGIAGRARRLEVMVDAVLEVERRAPGSVVFDVILAPGDQAYIDQLRVRAGAGGVVRVLPPVGFEEIVPTLAGYDVGVFVCPPVTFNLEHALPNKFFEFVQARLAVVVGPSVEMAPLVREHGFGVVASGFGVGETADAIAGLSAGGVAGFKAASDGVARELSAGELSRPWVDAVTALIDKARLINKARA